MYGGTTLLFYGAGEHKPDGWLNGLQCRVWRHRKRGMHARDLYLLANRLKNANPLGFLSAVLVVRD